MPHTLPRIAIPFGLVGLWAAALLPRLDVAPPVFIDEVWPQTMPAYTLAFEGRPYWPGQEGWGGVGTCYVRPQFFPALIQAGVYRIFGFGVLQSRLTSVAVAGLFLLAVWIVMRRLFDGPRAALIVALTTIDPWFFAIGRQVRPEIYVAALLWWAVACALGSQRARGAAARSGLAALAGLLAGVSFWTHPVAAVFAAGAACGLVLAVRPWRALPARLAAAAVGGLVGLLPFVVYVLSVAASYDITLREQVGDARITTPYARPIADMLATEQARWMSFLRLPSRWPLLALLIWGAGRALLRGRLADRGLAVAVVAAAVCMPLVAQGPLSRYLAILTPALAALVVRSIPLGRTEDERADAPPRGGWLPVAASGLVLLTYVALTGGGTALLLYRATGPSYDAWAADVAAHVPAGARVLASPFHWPVLRDREFISNVPPYYAENWRDADAAAAFIRRRRPEIIVQSTSDYTSTTRQRPNDFEFLALNRGINAVLATIPHELLHESAHPSFGALRIWRLRWAG